MARFSPCPPQKKKISILTEKIDSLTIELDY